MSKQKTQETETENVVTENPVVQSELEGLSTEKVAESPKKTLKNSGVQVNTVATSKVSAAKKMNVNKFLTLYPQNIYVSTLLRVSYPRSLFTVDEWFQRIDELMNTPLYA